jgi:dephospho-CoA kinase
MKILIIGHARYGKDTLAYFFNKHFGISYLSSSIAVNEIFI